MRILALDLGTKTGWALVDDALFQSGTKVLISDRERKERIKLRFQDGRFQSLRHFINGFGTLGAIFYEDVQFCKTQYQAQLWGGLRAMVACFETSTLEVRGVPVGTLKKFATGKGNATKEMMARALYDWNSKQFEGGSDKQIKRGVFLCRRGTDVDVDDNEVDAIHLLRYAVKHLTQPCKIHP